MSLSLFGWCLHNKEATDESIGPPLFFSGDILSVIEDAYRRAFIVGRLDDILVGPLVMLRGELALDVACLLDPLPLAWYRGEWTHANIPEKHVVGYPCSSPEGSSRWWRTKAPAYVFYSTDGGTFQWCYWVRGQTGFTRSLYEAIMSATRLLRTSDS